MSGKVLTVPLSARRSPAVPSCAAQVVGVVDSAIDILERHEQCDSTGEIMAARFLLELVADLIEQEMDC